VIDSARRTLIERIHHAPQQCVIVVTGGGASAISNLLSVPGGSRTVLEAVVPYSAAALADWLRREPEHYCSEETALAMAAVAFERAAQLAAQSSLGEGERSCVGISCTAALVSDRPKRGDHRCFVSVQTAGSTATYSLTLDKGARDRSAEEALVARLILHALAETAGIADVPPLELLPGEAVHTHSARADARLVELLRRRQGVVWSCPDGSLHESEGLAPSALPFPPPRGILCGSFNPLHQWHTALRAAAERILGGPVYYEMSIRNVDKPPLDFLTIDRRRAQFTEQPLALTASPTFAAKADSLPGVTFVVGVDTAERIVQPKYYHDSEEATRAALNHLRDRGCRFLVAGRKNDGRFATLAGASLPAEFAGLFRELPETEFRVDISSTELRRREQG
jgi:nicotinamide mononucleotide (NMN) deamidase PncC